MPVVDWSLAGNSLQSTLLLLLLRAAFFFRILFYFSEARGALSINLPLSPLSALGSHPQLQLSFLPGAGDGPKAFACTDLFTHTLHAGLKMFTIFCVFLRSSLTYGCVSWMHVRLRWVDPRLVDRRWTKTHTYL